MIAEAGSLVAALVVDPNDATNGSPEFDDLRRLLDNVGMVVAVKRR